MNNIKVLAMCRVCLAEEVGMRLIANTHLQEVYEGLSLTPLETKDGRPVQVCYICCASLQNCHTLKQRCLQSEELLTQVLNTEVSQPLDIKASSCTQRLSIVHPVVHLSMDGAALSDSDDDGVGDWDDSFHTTDAADLLTGKGDDAKDIKDETQKTRGAQKDDNVQLLNPDLMKSELDDDETGTSDLKKLPATQKKSTNTTSKFNRNKKIEIELVALESVNKNIVKDAQTLDKNNKVTDTLALETETDNEIDDLDSALHEVKNDNDQKSKTNIKGYKIITKAGEKQYKCDLCNKCFKYSRSMVAHIATHTGVRPYTCDVCKKTYSYNSHLTRHKRSCHSNGEPFKIDVSTKDSNDKDSLSKRITILKEEKTFECPVENSLNESDDKVQNHLKTAMKLYCDACNKCFLNRYTLLRHIRTHSAEKIFSCDVCQRGFSRKYRLTRHMRMHTDGRLYACDMCTKSFFDHKQLKRHILIHTLKKPYKCEFCEKSFGKSDKLARHRRVHTGEKPYKCDLCDKYFSRPSGLNCHKRKHSGKKEFMCDICKKCFFEKYNLRLHMRVHTGVKPVPCDHCSKCFDDRSKLKIHLRTHTGEKPFSCETCGRCFSHKCHLESHKLIHTGEKPFKCDICSKRFRGRSSYKAHLNTHLSVKMFKCDVCFKNFSQYSSMKDHLRLHSGEVKPHECAVCSKRYTYPSQLKTHMRQHTGEKPYACDVCSKVFYQRSQLNVHMNTHVD